MPVDTAFATVVAGADPSSIGRPHVARAMMLAGYATSVDDAFARVLARGRPGYVPRQGLGPRQPSTPSGGWRPGPSWPVAGPRACQSSSAPGPLGPGGLEVHYGGPADRSASSRPRRWPVD
jgi:hypothetical protein